MMGVLIVYHPAAASSSLLPGWTFEGRAVLGGLISCFGGIFATGCKGFRKTYSPERISSFLDSTCFYADDCHPQLPSRSCALPPFHRTQVCD